MPGTPPDLNELYLFTKVVDHQGFTAAGAALDIPKSRLSRRIASLEARLGVRLLHRTSRSLRLTDAGRALYDHCSVMVAEALAGEAAVHSRVIEPSGQVSLSFSVVLTEIAIILQSDLMPRFMQRYPKISLMFQASSRHVDLIEENIDIALQEVSRSEVSSSVVRVALGQLRWGFVATPAYLDTIGAVDNPAALSNLDLLLYNTTHQPLEELHIEGPGNSEITIPVKPRLQGNSILYLKKVVQTGTGIACLPLQTCAEEIRAGKLRVVLPEWSPQKNQLALYFPTRRGMMPAVRAAIDFIKAEVPQLLSQNGYMHPE